MADTQSLFDTLAGAAGHPVNRIGLNGMVATGQALNGLRSAQTEDALAKAQDMRSQLDAKQGLGDQITAFLTAQGDPHPAEHGALVAGLVNSGGGKDFNESESGLGHILHNQAFNTVQTPGADPNARLAADQALNPGANPVQAVGNQLIPRFAPNSQGGAATVQQTPLSSAETADKTATANLHQVQADAGGFNPNTGKGGMSHLPQEQQDAINKAMDDGRLNFKDLNSRNVDIIGSMAMNNPNYNFNAAAKDAALSRNSTFQQKNMVLEGLPGNVAHVVDLGKNLKYPDLAIAGEGKKWLLGQTNDPDLTEYMGARNDTILKIAGVMRAVGMSDKAHAAEEEAMHPTLSPKALDAWARAQMSAIKPLMEQQRRAAHIGEPGANSGANGPVPTGTTPQGGATPSVDDPLGIRSK